MIFCAIRIWTRAASSCPLDRFTSRTISEPLSAAPVYIPKVYNGRNRTFFFLSYEGFRNRVGATNSIASVPTPEMYQGDFSKWVDSSNKLLPIYDPSTTRANPNGSGLIRDPFPNNQIPQNRFSAFSKLVEPFGVPVAPNRPGLVPGTSGYVRNNYISTAGTLLAPQDKGSVEDRRDAQAESPHRVFL